MIDNVIARTVVRHTMRVSVPWLHVMHSVVAVWKEMFITQVLSRSRLDQIS